jgi:hypothetical protein
VKGKGGNRDPWQSPFRSRPRYPQPVCRPAPPHATIPSAASPSQILAVRGRDCSSRMGELPSRCRLVLRLELAYVDASGTGLRGQPGLNGEGGAR